MSANTIRQETEFTGWSSTVTTGSFGSGSVTTQPTGGNPGAYLQATWVFNSTSQDIAVFSSSSTFMYDPSVSGAISSLDFSVDDKLFAGNGAGQGFSIAILQNGTIYVGGNFMTTGTSSAWSTTTQTGLTAASFGVLTGLFGQGAGSPDFSRTGAPIRLGLLTWEATYGLNIQAGYDNLTYSIQSPTPEPASFLLLGAGLLGFGATRRLRASSSKIR